MKCTQCSGRAVLPLCNRCIDTLDGMLSELCWLLGELEVTAARQDRLTIGESRQFGHPAPANYSACELLRSVGAQVEGIALALNPTLPDAPAQLVVWWLRLHLPSLVRLSDADKHFRVIQRLVGFGAPGPIHDAINRPDRRFAGPCPDCGTVCHARHEDVYTACSGCGLPIDVEKNRAATLIDHDLLPEKLLLTVLDNLDEHVPRVTLYSWITGGKLLPRPDPRGRRGPRVYSLARARALRRHEQTPEVALARP